MTHQAGTDKLYPDRLRYVGFDQSWVVSNNSRSRQIYAQQAPCASDNFFGGYDPHAVAWAEEHGADLLIVDAAGNPMTDILRMLIRQTIAEGMHTDALRTEIADNLRNVYAYNPKVAQVIADTEISLAQCFGAYAGAVSVGMKVKRWLLSNDEGVCPICTANAAQGWIAIDMPYASGAWAPLDHAGCRCDAAYRRAVP